MENFVDICGRTIEVGDKICYPSNSNLRVGVVLKVSDRGIVVSTHKVQLAVYKYWYVQYIKDTAKHNAVIRFNKRICEHYELFVVLEKNVEIPEALLRYTIGIK